MFVWAIILNFDRAIHESLIQNKNYQQSPEKTKNDGEHERQCKYFNLLSSFTNAIDLYT